MKTETIINIANELSCTYDTSDPAEFCREAGVILLFFPMGDCKASCKGFILNTKNNTAITVSSDLSAEMRRIVIFHELAHFFLHVRTGLADTMHDFAVASPESEMEYEADMLAAELSIPDDAVLDMINEGKDFFDIAVGLNTIPAMLDFKFRLLTAKGYSLPEVPIYTTGGFLRQA